MADPHAGDQQQIVVRADLDGAFGAAEARAHAAVLPRDRGASGEMVVKQPLQRSPPGQVDLQQFVDPVARHRAVAEHQLDLVGHRHAVGGQGVGICRELQQRLDLHRAGQFGVAQPVPVACLGVLEDQEVREADEPAVEHGGLIDGGDTPLDGVAGGFGRCGQPGDGVLGPADDGHVVVRRGAQFVEMALLVLAAELGRPGKKVVVCRHRGAPAELGVERAQQGVLAPGCGGEVGRAVDDVVAGSGFRRRRRGGSHGRRRRRGGSTDDVAAGAAPTFDVAAGAAPTFDVAAGAAPA